MNVKKFLWSTVLGFIVMFILSWIGHEPLMQGLLFDSSPMAEIERESPAVIGIAAAYLVLSLLMVYIYPRGIEGDSVFGNGIRFGIVMGLLIALPISIILYSTLATVPFTRVIVETVWHVVEQGAGGVVIAYAWGMESASSTGFDESPAGPEASEF